MGKPIWVFILMISLLLVVACDTAAPEVVEKEVIKEVLVEKIVEKEKLVEVIKEVEKLVVATPTAAPPPGSVKGPSGSVISATSDMAEMGMDPSLDNTGNVRPFTNEMYIYAIEQAPSGELIGGAATKWEVSDDHLSWIWTVREGVKFHNGETMTAEDFSWSWNRAILSPEAETGQSFAYGPNIESIRAEGNTVVVRTKQPEALMPIWWAPAWTGPTGAILSQVEFERTGVEGIRNGAVGAGPYKFVQRSRGEFVKLEAFEDHYCCVPGFKELTVLEIPEIATRLALLKTGGADLVEATPSVKRDIEEAGFRTYSALAAQTSTMFFMYQNIPQSPFYDQRVREAINLAIDRESIAERIYAGEASANTSYPSGPGTFGFAADLEPYPYDLDRAKQLMKDAGYEKGFKVRIVTYLFDADFPDMPTLSQALLGYLQDLGIEGNVQVMEYSAVKGEMVSVVEAACGKDQPLWCTGVEANPEVAAQEPYTLILRGTDARFMWLSNLLSYNHPNGRRPIIQLDHVAAAIDGIYAEFDLDKQRALAEDYNRLMHREYRQTPLLYGNAVFGISDKIASWQPISGRTYPHNHWSLLPAK
ncbi:MAG: ABC transporter substrate-binding protein [Chloroflexi bacterium]|nr:ABC transporter substrate-binding protein [Chloroflexota bacterium]